MELRDGRRFTTPWGSRASNPDESPLTEVFTDTLRAVPVATGIPLGRDEIARVLEEITPDPAPTGLPRITLQTAPLHITPRGRVLLDGAADALDGMDTLRGLDDIIDAADEPPTTTSTLRVCTDGRIEVVLAGHLRGADCIVAIRRTDRPSPAAEQADAGGEEESGWEMGGAEEALAETEVVEPPTPVDPALTPPPPSKAEAITPRGRRILPAAVPYLDGEPLSRVDDIIDDPALTHPGYEGAMVYSDSTFDLVIGAEPDSEGRACVLRIMPTTKDLAAPSSLGRAQPPRRAATGKKHDARRSLPTTVKDFLERCQEYGFEVDDSRRHYSISHSNRPGVSATIPRSPSDHRWAKNQVRDIRLTFGIDIRQPL